MPSVASQAFDWPPFSDSRPGLRGWLQRPAIPVAAFIIIITAAAEEHCWCFPEITVGGGTPKNHGRH